MPTTTNRPIRMPTTATRSIPGLFFRGVLILAGLVALVLLGGEVGEYVPEFAAWVDGLGVWGPTAFIAGYTLATAAFVPGVWLTLTAGVIFGVLWGTLYVLVGAVLGSAAAFLIARYLARDAVERRLEGNRRFAALDRAIGGQGLRIVFLLRLSPVVPYNVLNYALGLTRVSFSDYLIASVGMIPGTLLYVYSGKVVGDVAAVAAGTGPERGVGYYVILAFGLAATVVVTVMVTRLARNALREETDA